MFHNIRGLTIKGTDGLDTFINEQLALQVDIQGFSEHCLDTTKFHVVSKTRAILRKQYQGPSILQLNSSTEPAINVYKPGGTGIMVLGSMASRLEPNGKGGDPMGRWSYVHFRRKDLPTLTVIAIYQVCPRPTNSIGNTAYHQQERALHLEGRTQMNPRQAFTQDLDTFITTLRQHNHDIILGGDFNESATDHNSGLTQLASRHNLVDPFLHKFPHYPDFGTHAMGRRRIDIALMTPTLMRSLLRVGYAPFDYSKSSDHRPMLLEFDSVKLLGITSDQLSIRH